MRRLLIVLLIFSMKISAQETGVNQIKNFDEVMVLRNDVLSLQQSSHDPTGGNDDGFTKGNFPGTYNGENIMLHVKGRGIVNRIWLTGYNHDDKIKIYFDGSTFPAVNETVGSFFSGTKAPFLSPLVCNDEVSSGGFFSYHPFPFEEEIMITTTGNHFYNINYQLYQHNNQRIKTWTGNEDLSNVYSIFNNKGEDPRVDYNYTSSSNTLSLSANETKTALRIDALNQSVSNLFISVPQLEFKDLFTTSVTDNGNATIGYSQFKMKINPNASNVTLVRRMDYWVENQKANVYVDGALVGEWYTPGGDGVYRWRDAEFNIPSTFTSGKNEITVKVQFVSSMIDWNEFYYWIYCDDVLTDEIDVADELSESTHSYIINPKNWSGVLSSQYPSDAGNDEPTLLSKVTIQIFYDNELTPSVDVPLNMFFGGGSIDNTRFQSLPVGVIEGTNTMYSYFPMPFKNSYELKLVNNSNEVINDIDVTVNYQTNNFDPEYTGYFKAKYNRENPPVKGKDYTILNVSGKGKYVGMVLEGRSASDNLWLEGDERFYIDGCRTPVSYGTGTEDYFNGAWYFNRGPFALATHGLTTVSGSDRTVYRFHLSDPVYFNKEGVFGIEHGPVNDISADFRSVAFYYLNENTDFLLTDEVDIGNEQSESSHNYTLTGTSSLQLNKSYYFEGDNDQSVVAESGRYIDGSSEFTVNIEPGKAVRIKRMFDYGLADQSAKVYVDNEFVGEWYTNGSNSSKRWREEFFMIPSGFTINKSQITIKIEAETTTSRWTEFHYWVYSATTYGTAVEESLADKISIYPNPAVDFVTITSGINNIKSIRIFDIHGRLVKTLNHNTNKIYVSDLNQGIYLINIITNKGVVTKRIIKK